MRRSIFYLIVIIAILRILVGPLRGSEVGVRQSSQDSNASIGRTLSRDRAEDDAYKAAIKEPNPIKRALALAAFIDRYPNSGAMFDAFEQAMASYQIFDEKQFREAASQSFPEIEDNNIAALTVVVFFDRMQVSAKGPESSVTAISCARAKRGLLALSTWQRPRILSDHQYTNLYNRASGVLNGMVGFCAYMAKSYAEARLYYLKALQIDPNNIANVGELAVADLEIDPIDVSGFWYAARAVNLSIKQNGRDSNVVADSYPYGQYKYEYYHGSRDGWDQIVQQAATQTAPPPGFTVERAQTPGPRRK